MRYKNPPSPTVLVVAQKALRNRGRDRDARTFRGSIGAVVVM